MSTNELDVFDQKINDDPEFKILVEDVRSYINGIEEQALKEKLNKFHDALPHTLQTKPKKFRRRQFQFMKIAALVVLFVAIGSFWFLNGSSNERLYNSHFKPDPGLPTTMSTSSDYPFYDAMVNYKQGDYQKAIAKWDVLQKITPQNDTLNYFLGVAHLANKSETKAIPFLEYAASQPKSVFVQDANYYLGLAFLKKDDSVNAIKFLKLSDTEDSKKLLEKLDK